MEAVNREKLESISQVVKKHNLTGIFDSDQIGIILRGHQAGLSVEKIQMYARPEFPISLMEDLLKQF